MAWTIPTFSGTEATGIPSGWRAAMFEFCRAVNEREECIPLVKTKFRKADGVLGSDLSMDDFLGMNPAGDYALENWDAIQQWILDHLVYFTTTSGGTTVWTRGALEVDMDIFSFLPAPRSTTDALYLQQCKEAFDRLIYMKIGIAVTPNFPFSHYATVVGGDSAYHASMQAAWDEALGESNESTPGGLIPILAWSVFGSVFDEIPYYLASLSYEMRDVSIYVQDFKGTVVDARQSVSWQPQFYVAGDGDLIDTMSSAFLGNTYSIPNLIGNIQKVVAHPVSIGGLTRGSLNTADWTTNRPATVPFSAPGTGKKVIIEMRLSSIIAYVDIAAELTDQS